jgi:hypothetical protein
VRLLLVALAGCGFSTGVGTPRDGSMNDTPDTPEIDAPPVDGAPASLGWVRTEYENQRDATTFYMLGDDVPAQ